MKKKSSSSRGTIPTFWNPSTALPSNTIGPLRGWPLDNDGDPPHSSRRGVPNHFSPSATTDALPLAGVPPMAMATPLVPPSTPLDSPDLADPPLLARASSHHQRANPGTSDNHPVSSAGDPLSYALAQPLCFHRCPDPQLHPPAHRRTTPPSTLQNLPRPPKPGPTSSPLPAPTRPSPTPSPPPTPPDYYRLKIAIP